jgi:hypothetical protein
LIPCEDSRANRRRLGHISKQGNSLLRFLLVEAAQAAVRGDAEWRRRFVLLAMLAGSRVAKVAMARKLARQFVLDVAQGMELRTGYKVRFAGSKAQAKSLKKGHSPKVAFMKFRGPAAQVDTRNGS